MKYAVLQGDIAPPTEGDKYKDNMPKFATDLTIDQVPLKMRMDNLDTIQELRGNLKKIEIAIITDVPIDSLYYKLKQASPDVMKRIKIIVDRSGILVECEIKDCDGKIPPYMNICKNCLIIPDGKARDLMILRNIDTRLAFLEHQISSSLSNQLTEKELLDATNEVAILSNMF